MLWIIHPSLAYASFIALGVTLVASLLYLSNRDSKWDDVAYPSMKFGFVFMGIALALGMFWSYVQWKLSPMDFLLIRDPKVTTYLIAWLLYLAYLQARVFTIGQEKKRTVTAFLAIIGFIGIVFTYLSSKLLPGLHSPEFHPFQWNPLTYTSLGATFAIITGYGISLRHTYQKLKEQRAELPICPIDKLLMDIGRCRDLSCPYLVEDFCQYELYIKREVA